jgi:hypothetical protein
MDLTGLSIEEINTILAGLAKLSYEQSVVVIDKVKSQGEAQLVTSGANAAPTVQTTIDQDIVDVLSNSPS